MPLRANGEEKEMLWAFEMVPTKTRWRYSIPKGDETIRCIQDSVCNLLAKVPKLAIQRHEFERSPSRRPIQNPEGRSELQNAVQLRDI